MKTFSKRMLPLLEAADKMYANFELEYAYDEQQLFEAEIEKRFHDLSIDSISSYINSCAANPWKKTKGTTDFVAEWCKMMDVKFTPDVDEED